MMSTSSSSSKICFNANCSELRSESSRKGWRLRSGDFAELCDRCASAYEEGRFCEKFHIKAAGWRCCESCGKGVHCGCIVSIHAFTLLDVGGIQCITCARKNIILANNSVWPSSSSLLLPVPLPERLKDFSTKNWSHLSGAGPVPWRQAPSLFNTSTPQSESYARNAYELDLSTCMDRPSASERLTVSSSEEKKVEDFSDRFMNGVMKVGASEIRENGNTGMNCIEQFGSHANTSCHLTSVKDDTSTATHFRWSLPHASTNENNCQAGVALAHSKHTPPPMLSKQFHGVDLSGEIHIRNGKPRGDGRGKNQLLSRYCPRITNQELQQLSEDPNLITPLFEKMLSASDAGRIGRLVLPKKCAEAYFPPITTTDGLPLKVQDVKGQEWIFQFRFWPNNNSRMYVLEGVTPCIQSMQLLAGDVVTFSRLEPEGKLIMGFRKASTVPSSDQGTELNKTVNGVPTYGDADLVDPAITWAKVDKSGYIAKDVPVAKSFVSRKRKASTICSKSRRLRIDNMELIELKITWEEAQGLLRPPPNHMPSVVMIEGFEFEEYEDAPVIGKPTIFSTDNMGEKIQWVQCEDCSKWRKLRADALLSSHWICSKNLWDPKRSSCSAAEEVRVEQIDDLIPVNDLGLSKKMKVVKEDPARVEALEGLDALANLAILGESEVMTPSSRGSTTKHPRHRPGCSCIVCIQPPSGQGPKHKPTCTCNFCLIAKRRVDTLMSRREKIKSEKEVEVICKNLEGELNSPEILIEENPTTCGNTENSNLNLKECKAGSGDDTNRKKSFDSPFKGKIDLNIQPEKEEELSPSLEESSDSGSMRLHQGTSESFIKNQKLLSSADTENFMGTETQVAEGLIEDRVGLKDIYGKEVMMELIVSNNDSVSDSVHATLGPSHQEKDVNHPIDGCGSTSALG